MSLDLQPLARGDFVVGRPLSYPIYDRHGKLLLAAGQAVQSEAQLQALCMIGLYRNPRWHEGGGGVGRAPEGGKAVMKTAMERDAPTPERSSAGEAYRPPVVATDDAVGRQVLKMSTPGSNNEFSVRLLGVNPETSLIVSAPALDGKLVFVKEGQVFHFRGFFGHTVQSFDATILKVQFSPYPYLHISWPDASKISRRRIRSARRAKCRLPCVVYYHRGGAEKQENGFVSDLSVGGAELWLAQELPHSFDNFRVAFKINVSGQRILIESAVTALRLKEEMRKSSGPQGVQGAHYGMAFEPLSEYLQLAIHAYINELLVTQLESPLGQ